MLDDAATDAALLAVVKASPDAVILFTMDGTILWANEATPAIFGWEPEELIGTNMGALLHPDELVAAAASVADIVLRGRQMRTPGLMRYRRSDGSYVLIEIAGNPCEIEGVGRVMSCFGRRADDHLGLREAMARLAMGLELGELLSFLPPQLGWRHDCPHIVIAWQDDDGVRHVSANELPSQIIGLPTDLDELSPWHKAWLRERHAGSVSDLPAHLRLVAEPHDLVGYQVEPIQSLTGSVRVVLTFWSRSDSLNLAMLDNLSGMLLRLTTLTLHFAEQQQQLVHLADNDALTGLANRRKFHEAVVKADGESARAHEPIARTVAVIYVDLDDFKPVNEQHGHHAGDLVLLEVARRLRRACRPNDVIARIGGDELAVLIVDCTQEEAEAVAQRFVHDVGEQIDIGSGWAQIHASVGVALGADGDSTALALRADEAMYEAKRAGGCRVVVAGRR